MNREERIYSVTMTEDELKLFSEFLEQREYAGPVKMQNKALKRQVLIKKHNIPTYTSEGGKTVRIEQAKGPRRSRYIPSEWVKDSRGIEQRKKGTGIRIPAVERTSAQQAQEKAIQEARKQERSIPDRRGSYHYGAREENRKNLNIDITNGNKTNPHEHMIELDRYKGEKHIATRSKIQEIKDNFKFGGYYKDPDIVGVNIKNIKIKGLE